MLGGSAVGSIVHAWTPRSIGACVLWLRTDLGITLDASNQVLKWNNQCAIVDPARDFSPVGANDRPAWNRNDSNYNNQATVGTFKKTGVDNNCRLVSGTTWTASYSTVTLAIVGHVTTPSSNHYFTHGNGSDYYSLVCNAGGTVTVYSGDATTLIGSSTWPNPKGFVMSEFNGASSAVYVDATVTPTNTGTHGTTSIGNEAFNLGSFAGAADTFGVDRIAELIVINGLLSTRDRILLREYLNQRYAKSMTT